MRFQIFKEYFFQFINYDKYFWSRIWGRTSSSPFLLLISSPQRGISGTRQPQRHWISVRYTILDIQPAKRDIWEQAATEALDISQVYYTGYQSGILYWISSSRPRWISGTRLNISSQIWFCYESYFCSVNFQYSIFSNYRFRFEFRGVFWCVTRIYIYIFLSTGVYKVPGSQ